MVGGHGLAPGEECLTAGLLDELVLIMPPDHPWAGRRVIGPAGLAGQPLLMREEGSATRQVTERALQRANVRFTVGSAWHSCPSTWCVGRWRPGGSAWPAFAASASTGTSTSFTTRARTLSAAARVFLDLLERATADLPR